MFTTLQESALFSGSTGLVYKTFTGLVQYLYRICTGNVQEMYRTCSGLLGGGGGQLKKSQKKSKSISGILGWVLTFFDPKF